MAEKTFWNVDKSLMTEKDYLSLVEQVACRYFKKDLKLDFDYFDYTPDDDEETVIFSIHNKGDEHKVWITVEFDMEAREIHNSMGNSFIDGEINYDENSFLGLMEDLGASIKANKKQLKVIETNYINRMCIPSIY